MTSSKSRQLAPLASLVLKVVGVIVTLTALLDMVILPIPYQVVERQWQLGFVTQVVDRGIVPLVGIALIFTGYWIDSVSGAAGDRPTWKDLRFWAALFASLLGLLYLLMFPMHLNNVRLGNTDAQKQVEQEAQKAETQLQQSLNAAVQQQRAVLDRLLTANDEQLAQAVQANVITKEQADLVREFKKNPASLEPYLQDRVKERLTQGQTDIRTRKEQAIENARSESLKSGLRIGIGSLLLAIAYITIGWTGLRTLGQSGKRAA